jgi:tRNA-specific 2-thiouridylase
LDYLRFPLGSFANKEETRQHAIRFGLKVAEKPDSQDICFVPNGNYASIVSKLRPGALDPGEIVHIDGEILGRHEGVINYTIGQRKGIGISSSEPLYVVRLDAAAKKVIVGPKEALATQSIFLKEVNWLSDITSFKTGVTCTIKIRSSAIPIEAEIKALSPTTALVAFKNHEYGIAAGQAGVFYDGDRVLGGGWITNEIFNQSK